MFASKKFLLTFARTATKKTSGSAKNKRSPPGRRLGVKLWNNEVAHTGSVIMAQRGTKFHPGFNVGLAKNHTLYALAPGFVKYYQVRRENGKIRKFVGVEPFGFGENQEDTKDDDL